MPSPKQLSNSSDPRAQRYRALYPFAGLAVAVICMGAGVALFLVRASGQSDWEGTFIGIHFGGEEPGRCS